MGRSKFKTDDLDKMILQDLEPEEETLNPEMVLQDLVKRAQLKRALQVKPQEMDLR